MSVEEFVDTFGSVSESYWFYDHTIELRFDRKTWQYFRADKVDDNGDLEKVDGVTHSCHIIDKSNALIPWACKKMAQKLFLTVPITITKSGTPAVIMKQEDFDKLVTEAKSAHKEILEDAGDVGHAAHNWLEQYIKLELGLLSDKNLAQLYEDLEKIDPRAKKCCQAALHWMKIHNVRWISTEQKIFSLEHNFAGTMDGKALVDGCGDPRCCPRSYNDYLMLIDWKSSNGLWPEYRLQTAAYQRADTEENDTLYQGRWIIRLGKEDGEFEPWHLGPEEFEHDWWAFQCCLMLTRAIRVVEQRQSAQQKVIKALNKAEADRAREAVHRIACPKSKDYKGVRLSKCLPDGTQCEKCTLTYKEVHDVVTSHSNT